MDYTKIIGVVKTLTDGYQNQQLVEAHNNMPQIVADGKDLLKDFSVPLWSNDKDIIKYVKEFELDRPENLIGFLIEANFAVVESVQESVNELKLDILNQSIAKVLSAKSKIKFALVNESEWGQKLSDAQNQLFDAAEELKFSIKNNIQGIRKIDNRNKWQFFLKSKISLSEIDMHVACARYALETLIKAVEMQIEIAGWKRQNIDSSVVSSFQDFVAKEILEGDTCSLMHAYDKDKKDEYWLRFRKKYEDMVTKSRMLIGYVNDYVDEHNDIDFSQ